MKTFPPFDQVKDQAARYVAQKAQTALITSLREKAKIERFDEEAAKPADPAAPAEPATPAADPAKPKTP